jgi:hypothetical protein
MRKAMLVREQITSMYPLNFLLQLWFITWFWTDRSRSVLYFVLLSVALSRMWRILIRSKEVVLLLLVFVYITSHYLSVSRCLPVSSVLFLECRVLCRFWVEPFRTMGGLDRLAVRCPVLFTTLRIRPSSLKIQCQVERNIVYCLHLFEPVLIFLAFSYM